MNIYKIGDEILANYIYDSKASKRFASHVVPGDEYRHNPRYEQQLTPIDTKSTTVVATITGIAWRAMADFDFDCNEGQWCGSFTKEKVLLVRLKITGREYIVQFQDAAKLADQS